MTFLGIDWVGVNAENGRKLLLSLIFIAVVLLASRALRALVGLALNKADNSSVQAKFWTRQGVSLFTAVLLILGLLSIWFNDPTRLATAFGLMSAGLAFALQQVITSVAGYFVVLRGNTFTVGDRISMGGVRGDVIRLGFIQTTIMEMGQPGGASGDASMWVRSRQFTGRIVTVSNSKIFDEPVFNYTRDFPFIWEEMIIPITYTADRGKAEAIMLEATKKHAVDPDSVAVEAKEDLQQRFGVEPMELAPRVFYRITDNWLELTVRFVVGTHKIRGTKDARAGRRRHRHRVIHLRHRGLSAYRGATRNSRSDEYRAESVALRRVRLRPAAPQSSTSASGQDTREVRADCHIADLPKGLRWVGNCRVVIF